jgi:Cu2+-exporting ATPase
MVPQVFEIADSTRHRIRTNLGWALTYNAVAIPLAVTGALNPLLAAFAMAASSLVVVGNSVRSLDSDGSDERPTTERTSIDADMTTPQRS